MVVRAQSGTMTGFQGITLSHYHRRTRGEAAAMRRCTTGVSSIAT